MRPAHAYRPFDGTDADVAGLGEFEAEVGPIGYLREGTQDLFIVPEIVLNLGFYHRLELVVQTSNFVPLGPHPGLPRAQLGDAGIFIKVVLIRGTLQESEGPSLALEIGPTMPALWPQPVVGGSGALILSMRWSALAVHLNQELRLGNTLGQVPGQQSLYLLEETNLIVEGPASWPVRPVLEGLLDYTFKAITAKSLLIGAIWRLDDAWAFDLAGRIGDESGSPQAEARIGVTWTVPVWQPSAP